MKALIFDTETNGWQKARPGVEDNTPRIIQIAWQIGDLETYQVVKEEKHLIRPHGWAIPKTKFFIQNGFSTNTNYMYGVPLPGIIDIFLEDHAQCDIIVAHNMEFDTRVLASEMKRYGKKAQKTLPKYCTMKSTKELCQLKDKRGNMKVPKLEELFFHIFRTEMPGAHDAAKDVKALCLCFFELHKNKLVIIE